MDFTSVVAQRWGTPIWFIPAVSLTVQLKSPCELPVGFGVRRKLDEQPIAVDEVERLAIGFMDVKLKSPTDTPPLDRQEQPAPVPDSTTVSPDDRLEQALQKLREAAATDLLDNLLQVSPNRFEFIFLDMLHNLGYGAGSNDLLRTRDGGIDRVISLDKLGLEKIYVEAKHWQGSVDRPELQAFCSALVGQKAKRGVFITTSGFKAQAIDFTRSIEGVVLIDEGRLVNSMMDDEIGVTSCVLKLPKLDSDYFNEK